MGVPLPAWVEEAARLPLAFAQVREDARHDLALIEQQGPALDILMVASGGCTAAALMTSGRVRRLHLADINPAQLALAQIKLWMAQHFSPKERVEVLGHLPLSPDERGRRLEKISEDAGVSLGVLGPRQAVLTKGPDHVGRYEYLFAQLRHALAPHQTALEQLVQLDDTAEQEKRVATGTPLGDGLERAFEDVMALPVLIRLFGEGATQNRVESFAQHFLGRTRHALSTLPAKTNPYLSQIFLGRFSSGAVSPWLETPAAPSKTEIIPHVAAMGDVLSASKETYDFVHLSNILDWLTPGEAAQTLGRAAQALKKGGVVIIRQLNSSLDIPALGVSFEWLTDQARRLHASDRSFFYRQLHIGKKR